MMDWADSGWLWWMLPMTAFMATLIVAVVWAVVTVARGSDTSALSARPTSEDILNDRFVRGEIDSVEYRERIDELRDSSPDRKGRRPART